MEDCPCQSSSPVHTPLGEPDAIFSIERLILQSIPRPSNQAKRSPIHGAYFL